MLWVNFDIFPFIRMSDIIMYILQVIYLAFCKGRFIMFDAWDIVV